MINPTVGRMVWAGRPKDTLDPTQPETAQITYVHNERLVNVVGWNHKGHPFVLHKVTLLQDDDPKPEGDFVMWMPYQKGQAARTEQLEQQQKTPE